MIQLPHKLLVQDFITPTTTEGPRTYGTALQTHSGVGSLWCACKHWFPLSRIWSHSSVGDALMASTLRTIVLALGVLRTCFCSIFPFPRLLSKACLIDIRDVSVLLCIQRDAGYLCRCLPHFFLSSAFEASRPSHVQDYQVMECLGCLERGHTLVS